MKPASTNPALVKSRLMLTGLLAAAVLCLPVAGRADTQTTHRVHKVKKQQPPPPLPSGTQGPVPQVPLDAIPAVAPQVNYQDGLLTIVAPNSTLGDILRSVRKHTSADIDIPATANERVVTRLGPGPVRDVMAELLNGSHFNYILLGSPNNANSLVRVVLVAKTGPDNPPPANAAGNPAQPAEIAAETPEPETQEDSSDDNQDQTSAEAEQQQQPAPDQPGVRTPQQMLQEMQQRQLQMQQQQQQPGQPPIPYPSRPGIPVPQPPQQQ